MEYEERIKRTKASQLSKEYPQFPNNIYFNNHKTKLATIKRVRDAMQINNLISQIGGWITKKVTIDAHRNGINSKDTI